MIRLLLFLVIVGLVALYAFRTLKSRRRERLAVARSMFLVSIPPPGPQGPAMKEVGLRSGVVSLRVPKGWAEEYPTEEEALFREPGDPLRAFRLTATVVPAVPKGPGEVLRRRAGPEASSVEALRSDTALLKRVQQVGKGDGRAVAFEWLLATHLPDDRVRVTACSLTVPETAALDPLTRDTLALLDHEVRAARLGQT